MGGNLLTKLKHMKVQHKAVSPHLIREHRPTERSRRRIRRERSHLELAFEGQKIMIIVITIIIIRFLVLFLQCGGKN